MVHCNFEQRNLTWKYIYSICVFVLWIQTKNMLWICSKNMPNKNVLLKFHFIFRNVLFRFIFRFSENEIQSYDDCMSYSIHSLSILTFVHYLKGKTGERRILLWKIYSYVTRLLRPCVCVSVSLLRTQRIADV